MPIISSPSATASRPTSMRCRRCARRAISRKEPAMLRRHQLELNALCEEISQGRHPWLERIICPVAPGGGKSLLPLILASHLPPTYADKICWVVPRLSLQAQAEREFVKPVFRRLLRHRHELRQGTNDLDPSRGLSGYITTYQA